METKEIRIPSYISVTAEDFERLIEARTRLAIIREYMRESEYARDEVVRIIAGGNSDV